METKRTKLKVVVSVLALAGLLVFSLFAVAGDLEPIAPPGPTMHTLDETYNVSSEIHPLVEPQADDMFLWIDGIPGESTDDRHTDWIELLSYSHCVSQPSADPVSSGGSRTAGRSEHCDFLIMKTLDKASPKLALFVCNGKHIPEIRFELCTATDPKQKFMEYTFHDVVITSVRPGGSSAVGTLPEEEVSFSYGRIEWTYVTTDPRTGQKRGQISTYWDVTTNTGGER